VQPHREIARDPITQSSLFRASSGISRAGQTIAYTDSRILSGLFLIEGVR
jgi:hypothetical protein